VTGGLRIPVYRLGHFAEYLFDQSSGWGKSLRALPEHSSEGAGALAIARLGGIRMSPNRHDVRCMALISLIVAIVTAALAAWPWTISRSG